MLTPLQGFLGIKTAMDIHVAPKISQSYIGGNFRKPLLEANVKIVNDVTEGLKKIFEVENAL